MKKHFFGLSTLIVTMALMSCSPHRGVRQAISWDDHHHNDEHNMMVEFNHPGSTIGIDTFENMKSFLEGYNRKVHHLHVVTNLSVHHLQQPFYKKRLKNIFNAMSDIVHLNTYQLHVVPNEKGSHHNRHKFELVMNDDQYLSHACPGWNYSIGSQSAMDGEVDFGCSQRRNLSKMASRYGDLIKGRGSNEVDIARANLAVKNYRADKVKKLLDNAKEIKSSK